MSSPGTTLIVGATGKQGGAAIAQLLKDSPGTQNLRALTRNTSSPAAQKLEAKGVKLFKGNLTDPVSLTAALTGCDSAFLMSNPFGPEGAESEVKQGKTFTDVAKSVGLKHLVFTSVGDADRASFVPHFHTKFQVEEYIRASGLSYTILRPVAFMDNLPRYGFPRFMGLGFFTTIMGGKKLQFVAVEDIGIAAAKALENPDKWRGKTIQLSGDDLSMDQVVDAYEKVDGVRPWRAWVPSFILGLLPYDFKMMGKFFREQGYSKSVEATSLLKEIHPGMMTMEQYLVKQKKVHTE